MKAVLALGGMVLLAVIILWVVISALPDGKTAGSDGAADRGEALAEVTVPATLSDVARRGQVAFGTHCASCHGDKAQGTPDLAPPLVHIYYEPNHHGDDAIRAAVALGVRQHHWSFGSMPPVEGVEAADVEDIIVYVRELQRANGIE